MDAHKIISHQLKVLLPSICSHFNTPPIFRLIPCHLMHKLFDYKSFNIRFFFHTISVPPHQILVYDASGRDVSGAVGPLYEGDSLVLSCEVRGGKWNSRFFLSLFLNISFLRIKIYFEYLSSLKKSDLCDYYQWHNDYKNHQRYSNGMKELWCHS